MENISKMKEQGYLSQTSGLSDTLTQAVKDRTLTRQVPDADTSASSVCQPALPLYRCGSCHRLLPAEAFYADRQGRVADNYCKECRRAANRKNRKRRRLSEKASEASSQTAPPKPRYVVITNLKDRSERLPLIINALETVRLRKKQLREKQHEQELREFEND